MTDAPDDRSSPAAGNSVDHDAHHVDTPALKWFNSPHAEQQIRTHGKWLSIFGGLLTLTTVAFAVVWEAGFHQEMPLSLLLLLMVAGLGGLVLGCLEYFGRYQRQMLRQILDEINDQKVGLIALVDLMDEDKRQAWYQGYVRGAFDRTKTGTDSPRNADVLKFHRRNEPV